MLTAAVRDLHRASDGGFNIDVRTSVPDLWANILRFEALRIASPQQVIYGYRFTDAPLDIVHSIAGGHARPDSRGSFA